MSCFGQLFKQEHKARSSAASSAAERKLSDPQPCQLVRLVSTDTTPANAAWDATAHSSSKHASPTKSKGSGRPEAAQSQSAELQASLALLGEVLRQLNGVQGHWLQKLHATAAVLRKELRANLVSIAALLDGAYSYAVLAADGVGSSELVIGVPHVVRPTGRRFSSLQRVFQEEAPVCASFTSTSDPESASMPPDWLAHASRHGSTEFVSVPVLCGSTLVGALSVAYNASDPAIRPWLLTPSALSLVAPSVGGLFRSEQLLLMLSLLEDLCQVKDIDTLVKVLARGVSELCAFSTYLVPQCRLALIRSDGLAAAVFEEPSPRRYSQVERSEPSTTSTSTNGTSASIPRPGPYNLHRVSPPHAPHLVPGDVSSPGNASLMGRPSVQLDLASYLNLAPGELQQYQQQHGDMSPAMAKTLVARHSAMAAASSPNGAAASPIAAAASPVAAAGPPPAAAAAAAVATNEAPPVIMVHKAQLDPPVGPPNRSRLSQYGISKADGAPPLPGMMLGHRVILAKTLLGEAIQKRSGVWIADCSKYLQEIKVMPLDITISRNSRTINSLAVCSACIPGTTKPLLGVYCTYPTTVPPLLLRAVTLELEQMLQALLPMVNTLLQSDVRNEWAYLRDDVLNPADISASESRRCSNSGSSSAAAPLSVIPYIAPNTTAPSHRAHAAASHDAMMGPSAPPPSAATNFELPVITSMSRLGSSMLATVAVDDVDVSGTADGTTAGSSLCGTEANLQSRGQGRRQRLQETRSQGRGASFTMYANQTAGLNGTLGPLLLGMQDKLRNLQAARLLNCASNDQLEELKDLDLVEQIGVGGYGQVFRGTLHGLEVAVKVIYSKSAQSFKVLNQRHPGRLQFPGCGVQPGLHWPGAAGHATMDSPLEPQHHHHAGGDGVAADEWGKRNGAAGGAAAARNGVEGGGPDDGRDGSGETDGGDGGGGDDSTGQLKRAQSKRLHEALELAVLFSVAHPHIVQVITFFTDVMVCTLGPDGIPPPDLIESLAQGDADNGGLPPHLLLLPSPRTATAVAPAGAAFMHHVDAVAIPEAPELAKDEETGSCRHAMVICMEYCDSGSLADAIQRGAFRESNRGLYGSSGMPNMPAIYTTMLEVAMALRHLHSLDLVHCDLKPENVLLRSSARDPRGFVCKISDFGLVHQMTEDECGRMVVRDLSSGTFTHMAPEVLRGDTVMDASLDIYAFGILMWQVVTGSKVYAALRPEEVVDRVLNQHFRPRFPPHVDAAYSALGMACLSAERHLRPTAAELVNSLKALMLASSPLHATRARRNSSTAYMVANTRAAAIKKLPSLGNPQGGGPVTAGSPVER